jgi:hypothetical protein
LRTVSDNCPLSLQWSWGNPMTVYLAIFVFTDVVPIAYGVGKEVKTSGRLVYRN